MLTIPITENMYTAAKLRAEKLGVLKGSIEYGRGNIYGYLGEEIFQKLFPDAVRVNNYEYDFELIRFPELDTPVKITVEVKSKVTSCIPQIQYEASVTKMPTQQACHVYFFMRIHRDTRMGWAIGWEYADIFYKKAYLKNEGDIDLTNGMRCKRSCYNIFHYDLRSPESFCLLIKPF